MEWGAAYVTRAEPFSMDLLGSVTGVILQFWCKSQGFTAQVSSSLIGFSHFCIGSFRFLKKRQNKRSGKYSEVIGKEFVYFALGSLLS